jgi:hypothetical protein
MPLSMCFFVSYTIDLTNLLFYIFHRLESLPGILVGRAIALLCVDKATSGDGVSTDVSAIRRSPAHCRHKGVQQLSLLGERLPSSHREVYGEKAN